jgi:hypothetical protein
MPNRYSEILEESLADFGASDAAQREQVYRQGRIALLGQFDADPSLSIEQRADELALFEAAVREVEARHAARQAADPAADAQTSEPIPLTEIYPSADDGPPLEVHIEAEQRLYGEPEEEDEKANFPWVRLALLVILAALGVWFVAPLFRQLDPPALYAGLIVNALALALIGAVLFLGSRRIWLGLLGAPLLFVGLTAAAKYSPGLEYAFEALFAPLSDQRSTAMDFELPVLSILPGGSKPAAAEQPKPEAEPPAEIASTPPPAENPITSGSTEPAPASPEASEPLTTGDTQEAAGKPMEMASTENREQPAPMPEKLTRMESFEPLLGDWDIKCENGPGHRLTLDAPSTTGQTDGSDFARGRLTGQAFAGTSKVFFKSPLAENEVERDIELPAHPWPANEWVYAQETVLLRAEYDGGGGEGAPIFSTFFMCPIKAENISAEREPDGRHLAIDTECSWYVPRPEDLDAFFSGSVFAQCSFRRPASE